MEGYHVSSLYVLRLKKSNFRRFHAISLLAEKYSCNERRTNSPHLTSFQFHGGKFISSGASAGAKRSASPRDSSHPTFFILGPNHSK